MFLSTLGIQKVTELVYIVKLHGARIPRFLEKAIVPEHNMLEKDHYGIGRCPGPLKREVIQCCSATVLQSERRKRLEVEVKISHVKLPAHRSGLPGNEISFFIVPLGPAYKAGLAGHLPVK